MLDEWTLVGKIVRDYIASVQSEPDVKSAWVYLHLCVVLCSVLFCAFQDTVAVLTLSERECHSSLQFNEREIVV